MDNKKLELFIFILIRDYITTGELEHIIKYHVDKVSEKNKPIFDDKNLQAYCEEVAKNFDGHFANN